MHLPPHDDMKLASSRYYLVLLQMQTLGPTPPLALPLIPIQLSVFVTDQYRAVHICLQGVNFYTKDFKELKQTLIPILNIYFSKGNNKFKGAILVVLIWKC
jgi:hypothetical protein